MVTVTIIVQEIKIQFLNQNNQEHIFLINVKIVLFIYLFCGTVFTVRTVRIE